MKPTLTHFVLVRKSDGIAMSSGACRPADLATQNPDPARYVIEETEPSDVASADVRLKRSGEKMSLRTKGDRGQALIERREQHCAAMIAAGATDFESINFLLGVIASPGGITAADRQRARQLLAARATS